MSPFPKNQAELLALVGNDLTLLNRKEHAAFQGVSVSTDKRLEAEDLDHPKKIRVSPNRIGFVTREARAYRLLQLAKVMYLEGDRVECAIRLLRGIIHRQVFEDDAPEATAAE